MISIYTLLDMTTEEFGMLFEQKTDAAAQRAIHRMITQGQLEYPEDFELYRLAQYDRDSGAIYPEYTFIIKCSDLVQNRTKKEIE